VAKAPLAASIKESVAMDYDTYVEMCPGCGRDVVITVASNTNATRTREPSGRYSYRTPGGTMIHLCREGRFA
jgi:hypothetical protein